MGAATVKHTGTHCFLFFFSYLAVSHRTTEALQHGRIRVPMSHVHNRTSARWASSRLTATALARACVKGYADAAYLEYCFQAGPGPYGRQPPRRLHGHDRCFSVAKLPPGVKALLLLCLAAPGMDVHLLEPPKVTFYAKVPRCLQIGTFRASYSIGHGQMKNQMSPLASLISSSSQPHLSCPSLLHLPIHHHAPLAELPSVGFPCHRKELGRCTAYLQFYYRRRYSSSR